MGGRAVLSGASGGFRIERKGVKSKVRLKDGESQESALERVGRGY